MTQDTEIIRVAARGEGMTAGGRYAPLAAPGDTLLPSGEIVTGPHHQKPPCRHFPQCGGCQLQHLDDAAYAGFITDRIASALAAQDLTTDIRAPTLSPPRSRRRATLHAERRGRQVHLGFTEQNSHALVDMQECWILTPDLFALLQPLRGLLSVLLTNTRRASVTLTRVDQGVDVLIEGVEATGLAAAEGLTAFAERHRLARLSLDSGFGPETRWEPEPVTITLGGVPVPFPTAAFLQATAEGEAALLDAVRGAVGRAGVVADLFAGLGTFAFGLQNARVYAAEAAREAILSLKAAAGRAQRHVAADHRDLYRRPLAVEELDRFAAIVLDPPRAGARDQIANLAASSAPVIAYVSCNPSSFARDAKMLREGGYMLDWVQPVGQFLWSTHVELAARFSR
ncbi:class I SAM-dependent RNA methyltransferase [Hephaestia mangrovi]|uniref:class I SAM-dependent RNA methyltransferase n=1 Tax=Hephaestia mangrovi TaxID=2873268 RepID=UPI001CA7AE35|nr:class I SAM-dependent RNA methyltransferase [Hephaestia mangrovi]MBY8827809.1 class I SAM-dependent RNA methyltransferase [Hephaestia mangrovi]